MRCISRAFGRPNKMRGIASGIGVRPSNAAWTPFPTDRIRVASGTQQGYLMRRCQLTEGFECFNALQMRRDIFEFVRLLFVPDNLVIMMQLFRCPLTVKRFIVT